MANFPTTFAEQLNELPPVLSEANNQYSADLAEKGFVVMAGLTPAVAQRIAVIGQEGHIRRFCMKDATEARFATEASTAKWLAKGDEKLQQYGRGVFTLMKLGSREPQLYGYGWTGPETSEKVPDGETTFAVRIAMAGIGKKLSIPFSRLIVEGTHELYDAEDIWLETWESNHAAHVYERVGFELMHGNETPGDRPTISGDTVPDTRLYMTFPNDQLSS